MQRNWVNPIQQIAQILNFRLATDGAINTSILRFMLQVFMLKKNIAIKFILKVEKVKGKVIALLAMKANRGSGVLFLTWAVDGG